MSDSLSTVWNAMTSNGMFEVQEIEIRGVPTRSYVNVPTSVVDIFAGTVATKPDQPYLVFADERYTYGEVGALVDKAAIGLASLGVSQGDTVAISMRNYPEGVVSYWATLKLGAIAVGMNAMWSPSEMAYGLLDCGAKVAVLDEERIRRFEQAGDEVAAAGIEVVAVRADVAPADGMHSWESLVATEGDLPEVTIDTDDDAMILYTSGTTGFPKGAVLTHRSCVNNIFNLLFWNLCSAEALKMDAAANASNSDEEPADDSAPAPPPSTLLAVPLFHVTGCNCVMHPSTLIGGKLVMMYKWDADEAVRLVEAEKITTMTGVPTMSREMLMSPEWEKRDVSSLASMGGGGAALQPDLVKKIDKGLPKGRPGTGYGLTEVSGVIAMNSAKLFLDKPETVGPILPTMEAKVIDEDGNDLPVGERGELCVRGSNIIRGYLNKEDATAEAIRDGWFRTGDIGFIDDDGFLTIADRAKDMVIRGGENIYCAEVEAVVYELDAVAEAAMFSCPDDRLGEVPGMAIHVRPDAELTAEEVRGLVRDRLAAFKVPEYIWFLDDPIPRNANGKFLKRELRENLIGTDAD